jgi:predicted NUDIX family NTP pyrophosphohydrolase
VAGSDREEHTVPKRSAGLLPFRLVAGPVLELFVVHPGGPLWAAKDEGAWSVAKGEYDEDEEAAVAAEREFAEEIGVAAPPGPRIDLGEVTQASGKRVRAWAVEAPEFEVTQVVSNTFEMVWPPRSGRLQSFPEVDRAEWMAAARARSRLHPAQVELVDRLVAHLRDAGPHPSDGL